jgi:hypothetical protein
MAPLLLASAKGSPGVSTLAALLGRAWPDRVLVVEADPAGGDLAARLGLAGEPSLVSLAILARSGLDPERAWEHAQVLDRGRRAGSPEARVIVGPVGSAEGRSLRPAWPPLAALLAGLPATVIVDAGRASAGEPSFAEVAARAAASVLVCRADLASASHARSLVRCWPAGPQPVLVVVGSSPYRPAEVAGAVGLELLGALPSDSQAAEASLAGQWSPGARALRRGIDRLSQALAALIAGRCGAEDPAGEAPRASTPAPAGTPGPAGEASR